MVIDSTQFIYLFVCVDVNITTNNYILELFVILVLIKITFKYHRNNWATMLSNSSIVQKEVKQLNPKNLSRNLLALSLQLAQNIENLTNSDLLEEYFKLD
jgi:hypothetical protein